MVVVGAGYHMHPGEQASPYGGIWWRWWWNRWTLDLLVEMVVQVQTWMGNGGTGGQVWWRWWCWRWWCRWCWRQQIRTDGGAGNGGIGVQYLQLTADPASSVNAPGPSGNLVCWWWRWSWYPAGGTGGGPGSGPYGLVVPGAAGNDPAPMEQRLVLLTLEVVVVELVWWT